ISVRLVSAHDMGRRIALELLPPIPRMRLVAIANRTLADAARAYREAGVDDVSTVDSVAALERVISNRRFAITDDALVLCRGEGIDAVIECTGDVEFGARVALEAI